MRTAILLFAFAIFFISSKLFSQETPHPIDVYLDSCMEKNGSTMGMLKCTDDAVKMWDDELNKYYKILMKILDDESAKALKSSEVQWIEFKEKEFKNIDLIYSKMDGTMYIPLQAYAKMEIIKVRAMQLMDYYGLLTGNN